MSETKIIKQTSDMIQLRWKTELCNSGESCWCRLIVTEEKSVWENGSETWVVPDGSITKEEAEHIVEIHNQWLDAQNK